MSSCGHLTSTTRRCPATRSRDCTVCPGLGIRMATPALVRLPCSVGALLLTSRACGNVAAHIQ
eukprot:232507-Prorocentrum_lima.AAC.1